MTGPIELGITSTTRTGICADHEEVIINGGVVTDAFPPGLGNEFIGASFGIKNVLKAVNAPRTSQTMGGSFSCEGFCEDRASEGMFGVST
jgi:hypothetical protein